MLKIQNQRLGGSAPWTGGSNSYANYGEFHTVVALGPDATRNDVIIGVPPSCPPGHPIKHTHYMLGNKAMHATNGNTTVSALPQQAVDRGVTIHNDSAGIRPLPPISEAYVTTRPDFDAQLKYVDELDHKNLPSASILNTEWKPSAGINRRFTVVASKQNTIKEEVVIGRVALPNKAQYTITKGAAHPHKAMTLAPAIAAMASTLKDRSYTAAIGAAQTLFNTGSATERFSNNSISAVRTLLSSTPDPTRFVFKLAQIYMYYRYCEDEGVEPSLVGTVEPPEAVCTISAISAALVAAKAGAHYVFVAGEQFAGNFDNVTSVLSMAASNLTTPPSQAHSLPSILTTSVKLPPIKVAYTGDSSTRAAMIMGVTAADIWEAAHFWTCAHNASATFMDCVKFISSQLYSTKDGYDEIFSTDTLAIQLPTLSMAHYALFPLHMAVTDLPELTIPDEPDLLRITSALTLRNQLLSVAFSQVLSRSHIGAPKINAKHYLASNRWLSKIFTFRGGNPCYIWNVLSQALVDLKINAGFSWLVARLVPTAIRTTDLNRYWSAPLLRSTQYEEVLDVVTSAPACSIAHMLKPVKSKILLQPNRYYGMDMLDAAWMTRAAFAVYRVGGRILQVKRTVGQLNVEMQEISVQLSYRNILHDCATPMAFQDDNVETKYVFVLPNAMSSIRLLEGDQAMAGCNWYISGVTAGDLDVIDMFRLSNALASETPQLSSGGVGGSDWQPPNITKAPVNDPTVRAPPPVFVPEPTEQELIDSIKKRVSPAVSEAATYLKKHLADGVVKNMADILVKCSDPVIPAGYSRLDWCRTFFGNLKEQMSGIGVADAIRATRIDERAHAANVISYMFRSLIPYTDYEDNRNILSTYAVRADNLALAMAVNPALTAAELTSDTIPVPSNMIDTLDAMSTTATEYGIPLSMFVSNTATIEDSKIAANAEEVARLQAQGYVAIPEFGQVGDMNVTMNKYKVGHTEPLMVETCFSPEFIADINIRAAKVLEAALQTKQGAIGAHEEVTQMRQDWKAIAAGLASDENDATIGRSGADTVAKFRLETMLAAGKPDQDFQVPPEPSGGGPLSQQKSLTGTPPLTVPVMEAPSTALPSETMQAPTSGATESISIENIEQVAFEDVE